MERIHHYDSPLGGITLSCAGGALTGLWFDGQKHFGSTMSAEAEEGHADVFDDADKWLNVYFSGRQPDFLPQIRLIGTDYQKAVWQILLTIPYGKTFTYGQVARMAAESMGNTGFSARAAGNAVARNPISLLVPCHRVIGADGSLTGYAGGKDRKKMLLDMEIKSCGIL